MNAKRRVLIIEDAPRSIEVITKALATVPEFGKPATCETTSEAWRALEASRPELIILDLALPSQAGEAEGGDLAGFELADELFDRCRNEGYVLPHVIVYSQNRQHSARSGAQKRGFSLVVKGEGSGAKLGDAIRSYLAGSITLPDADPQDLEDMLVALGLTDVERAFVRHFAAGRSDEEIVEQLKREFPQLGAETTHTMENWRSRIGRDICKKLLDDDQRPAGLTAPETEVIGPMLKWFLYTYVGIKSPPMTSRRQ